MTTPGEVERLREELARANREIAGVQALARLHKKATDALNAILGETEMADEYAPEVVLDSIRALAEQALGITTAPERLP